MNLVTALLIAGLTVSCPPANLQGYRKLCSSSGGWVMKCSHWAKLVASVQYYGQNRFKEIYWEALSKNPGRNTKYLAGFASDAMEYEAGHEFEHEQHAYASAMSACLHGERGS